MLRQHVVSHTFVGFLVWVFGRILIFLPPTSRLLLFPIIPIKYHLLPFFHDVGRKCFVEAFKRDPLLGINEISLLQP